MPDMTLLQVLLIALTAGCVFVNGMTDAPNAITGAVAGGALSFRRAVTLAAFCNAAGLLTFGAFNGSVAGTIAGLNNFGSFPPRVALAALLAAMAAVCCFAPAAWAFGIPTSESHALVAGLGGAALQVGADFSPGAWAKIAAGLLVSLLLSFFGGAAVRSVLGRRLERLAPKRLDAAQTLAAGAAAFMHGAQDGQKFAAVFIIADAALKGAPVRATLDLREYPLILLLCAAAMALGTAAGGRRIIETVGFKMLAVKKHESLCADVSGGAVLLLASLLGLPVSTTHVKTAALGGACEEKKDPGRDPAYLVNYVSGLRGAGVCVYKALALALKRRCMRFLPRFLRRLLPGVFAAFFSSLAIRSSCSENTRTGIVSISAQTPSPSHRLLNHSQLKNSRPAHIT